MITAVASWPRFLPVLHRQCLIAASLSLTALLLCALPLFATDRIDCGCAKTGSYVDPLTGAAPAVVPTSFNTGTSPNGIYKVTVSTFGTIAYITVNRISDNASLLY